MLLPPRLLSPRNTEEQRRELLQFAALRSVPRSVAMRARIVLGAAGGIGNKVLARQRATGLRTVLLWRVASGPKDW